MNDASRIVTALTPAVKALEQLGIAYHVGGSVASSAYGILRATFDIDLVADIEPKHIQLLVRLLKPMTMLTMTRFETRLNIKAHLISSTWTR